MKRSLGSMPLMTIVAICAAATACRDHSRPPGPAPSEANVSLTSASVDTPAGEQASEDTSKSAVCEPGDEAPVTPPSSAIPARSPTAHATRAPAPRPANHALNDAIAGAIAHEDGNATPPEPASEEIATNVTTTSAAIPVAPAPSLAPARVAFENRLPGSYDLERVRMLVDGSVAYDGRTPGSVWIAPGPHAVQVIATFRLNDPVLTYVRDYRINVQSTEQVPASARSLAVVAVAEPRGGVTAPMNQRAGVAWRSFPIK